MRATTCCCILLLAIFSSCSNPPEKEKKYGELTEADYKKDTLQVNGEDVALETATTTEEKQEKTPFGPKEQAWLHENLEKARLLKSQYWEKPMPKDKEFMPHILDEVFENWKSDASPNKKSPEFVSEAFGAAFGQWLVDQYQMKWLVVNDEYGTAYAVEHQQYSLIAYPVSSVYKGIDQDKKGLFRGIELTIQENIKALQLEESATKK